VLRSESFSAERLEEHAASLARAQTVADSSDDRLGFDGRLKANEEVLLDACRRISTASSQGRPLTPAAEWFLDNYHLVDEQIREVRVDLPPGFYRELPKLASGPFSGYPRVFGITWAFVAHTDSRFEPDLLRRMVDAYQRVQPLTIGELWAIAITLRIVLIENLRRAAQRMVSNLQARHAADKLADRWLSERGSPLDLAILERNYPRADTMSEVFAVQLHQRLQDRGNEITPVMDWLESQHAATGRTAADLVRIEQERQAASTVTVRNIITSMRLMSDVDWSEFFESVSLVDQRLRTSGDFAQNDFATRNLYRKAIEDLARHSAFSELQITERAIEATTNSAASAQSRSSDPGHYLIGAARPEFEATLCYRPRLRTRLQRLFKRRGVAVYLAIVLVVTGIISVVPSTLLSTANLGPLWFTTMAAIAVALALDAAITLVNHILTRVMPPETLPGLSLKDGVPEQSRTLVVIPALLTSMEDVDELLQRLEIHSLTCPEGAMHFALLTDWGDADAEHAPGDDALLDAATRGIERLNLIHTMGSGEARFFILHRRRVWSAGEGRWIGWERKRGKLHELNRLLRGATDTTFEQLTGDRPAVPPGVRYVITLDADTVLPHDSARRLIGKLTHPLNRAQFDPIRGRVIAGYGILQPRVSSSLPASRNSSIFQQVFSASGGIDPYAAAVSDVYQDLFGEGSYAGKGIYDVDAFEAALAGRVPDNTMLSHDLFEGIFARAALVTDVEVVEAFPSRYGVVAMRQHRWTRGDWQLLPWILGRRRIGERDSIPLLGRWKMLDNLRRSLTAPVAIAAFLLGWILPTRAAQLWTAMVLTLLAFPVLLHLVANLIPWQAGVRLGSHLRTLGRDVRLAETQTLLQMTFLASTAGLMMDAIVRTLFRLTASRRNLLQWTTAAQLQSNLSSSTGALLRQMAPGLIVVLIACTVLLQAAVELRWIAAPLLLLWMAAPLVARRVSQSPGTPAARPLTSQEISALRSVARRTWRFFETFVTEEHNYLPPDNFQEDPSPVVAHRTSPTNLGLYLLSIVAARDLGWITTQEAVARLKSTLNTMNGLQRFRGHFYNWYDTRTLLALEPKYISTVDSGNLAGHLITLANAAREWIVVPVSAAERRAGIEDALQLAVITLDDLAKSDPGLDLPGQAALRDAAAIAESVRAIAVESPELQASLQSIEGRTDAMIADLERLSAPNTEAGMSEALHWVRAARGCVKSWLQELTLQRVARLTLTRELTLIAATAKALAQAMQFSFLVDPQRRLFSIGWSEAEAVRDRSCYDLLASEARLASFYAIAKRDVLARHWFRLGRSLVALEDGAALLSWSGSMFEYLMPSLVMRAPVGSLLERTSRLIVARQISYARALGVPWGISESAFNSRDAQMTYQYSNFGVPDLGLKRGLARNLVISPYATALAAMVDPVAALRNFAVLTAAGARGRFGFYEALDYTPSRLPQGEPVAIVRAFMAHHQGMSIIAIANVVQQGRMRQRFHGEPSVQATELLLQERNPRNVLPVRPRADEDTRNTAG
ncbi:MAG TPA: glucoamylase family protein, partial [Povalibacter sp.]